jgi:hypothetical protein
VAEVEEAVAKVAALVMVAALIWLQKHAPRRTYPNISQHQAFWRPLKPVK